MTLLSILVVGFLLGIKHAAEADHVAAVATMATRSRSVAHALLQGAAWGIGHTVTLLMIGGGVLLVGTQVPERVAMSLEMAVGIMLVVLGLDVLYRLYRERIHFHHHYHESEQGHFHAHRHHADEGEHNVRRHPHAHPKRLPPRALLVGMVHGVAGSAALVLLTAQTIHSPAWAVVYILIFGVGSILGMAALSIIVMVPMRWSASYLTTLHHALNLAVGLLSLGLGAYMTYQLGFEKGLIYTLVSS